MKVTVIVENHQGWDSERVEVSRSTSDLEHLVAWERGIRLSELLEETFEQVERACVVKQEES